MTIREKRALAKIISFGVGMLTSAMAIAILGLAQKQDDHDAQIVAGQVMACSVVTEACSAAREARK